MGQAHRLWRDARRPFLPLWGRQSGVPFGFAQDRRWSRPANDEDSRSPDAGLPPTETGRGLAPRGHPPRQRPPRPCRPSQRVLCPISCSTHCSSGWMSPNGRGPTLRKKTAPAFLNVREIQVIVEPEEHGGHHHTHPVLWAHCTP